MGVIVQGSEQIVSGKASFFLCGTALTFYNYMLYLPLECLLHWVYFDTGYRETLDVPGPHTIKR